MADTAHSIYTSLSWSLFNPRFLPQPSVSFPFLPHHGAQKFRSIKVTTSLFIAADLLLIYNALFEGAQRRLLL